MAVTEGEIPNVALCSLQISDGDDTEPAPAIDVEKGPLVTIRKREQLLAGVPIDY